MNEWMNERIHNCNEQQNIQYKEKPLFQKIKKKTTHTHIEWKYLKENCKRLKERNKSRKKKG